MRLLALFASFVLFVGESRAQVTWFTNPNPLVNGGNGVGTPQSVPDPVDPNLPAGVIQLFGFLCPNNIASNRLKFECSGIPTNYNMVSQDTVIFALDLGVAPTTPTIIAGGTFHLPLSAALVSFVIGGVSYIGPGDYTCSNMSFAGTLDTVRMGAVLNLSSIIPATVQGVNLCIQATLFDSVLGRIFTSQALNFQV